MSSEKFLQDSIIHRALLNTASNYLGKFVILVTWFFLTPFILKKLGPNPYGIWILVGSLLSYGSLLDLGITNAVTKYIAEYHAKGDFNSARQLTATALWLYTGLGVAAILVGAVAAPILPHLFNLPLEQVETTSWLVFLAGIGLGVSLPAATPISVLRGLQRFDLINLLSITGTLLNALLLVTVLQLGWGVVGMVAVSIPLALIMLIPALWMIRKAAPGLQFGWKGAKKEAVRTVFTFSSAIFIIQIAGLLKAKTDELVIGANLPVNAVTPYSIAHRLSDIAQLLADQFMKIIMPLASQLGIDEDRAKLQNLYLTGTRLTLAAFLPIGCGIVILARPFLTAWVGAEYAPYDSLVLILTLASLMDTIMWPAGSVLQGIARHQVMALWALAFGIANLILSIWLVRSLGLTGVALGTLIPNLIECLFFVLPYTWRTLGIHPRQALTNILVPSLLPAIPTVLLLLTLRYFLQPTTLIGIGLVGGAGIVVYLAGFLAFKVSNRERKLAFNLAARVWGYFRSTS